MTEQKACTLCGAVGHLAAQCNWNTDKRPAFEAWVLREWPGAPLRFVRDALPKDDPRYGQYCDDRLQHCWVGFQAGAALAQPSPNPEGYRGISGCLIDATKNGHLDGWGISREEWYAAAQLLDGKQPSPAPELERPEVVGTLLIGEHFDGSKSVDATRSWHTEGLQIGAHHLMTVAQHDRIVAALRYKAELYDEVWELVTGKGYMNVTTAISKLEQDRDAALAKLAAMEQQEPVAFRISDPKEPEIGFWFGEDPASDWLVSEPLYAAPVAQAGQVPDASAQDKVLGWTLDYRFVERVTELAASRTEYSTSMEATEQVLLAARELLDAEPNALRAASCVADLSGVWRYGFRGTDFGMMEDGPYVLIEQVQKALSVPTAQAGQVPEARLAHVLGLVEGAMEDAYGNAFQVCCGKGRGGECCGDPEAGWSPEDQRTMDVLNPIHR